MKKSFFCFLLVLACSALYQNRHALPPVVRDFTPPKRFNASVVGLRSTVAETAEHLQKQHQEVRTNVVEFVAPQDFQPGHGEAYKKHKEFETKRAKKSPSSQAVFIDGYPTNTGQWVNGYWAFTDGEETSNEMKSESKDISLRADPPNQTWEQTFRDLLQW